MPSTNATDDITDEDSDDPRIDNVPGSQLNAPASIATLDIGPDPERDNANSETFTKTSKTTSFRRRKKYQWKKADLAQRNSIWSLYHTAKYKELTPLATDDITDEDSDDPRIDNVPGSQLNAPASIATLDIGPDPERDNANSETFTKTSKTTSFRRRKKYQWKKADLTQRNSIWSLYHTAKYKELTPLEYFQLLFDSEMIQMIVKYTDLLLFCY
ncbi:hypothetical protein QE152_g39494 [Popillia japonica]|uniref:Uncharacterized protein n=1 Tax=Popillia japonica TaxID=7064 RepID=A0AAW1HTX2_POPJA